MLKKLRTPLYLALLIPALLALTDFLTPIDHGYWNVRYKLNQHQANGSTVIVELESDSGHPDSDTVATPRLARVLQQLRPQMPYRVYVDAPVKYGTDAAGDRLLAETISSFGPGVSLVARGQTVGSLGHQLTLRDVRMPPKALADVAPVVVSVWNGNFIDYAVSSPYSVNIAGREYPTFAASLAGKYSGLQDTFEPDFLVEPDTIPKVSERMLLSGAYTPGLLTGRTIVVTQSQNVPTIGYYGKGRIHPLAVDIAGASGLAKPISLSLGQLPLLVIVWLLIKAGSRASSRKLKFALHALAALAPFVVAPALQLIGVTVDTGAAFLSLVIYGCARVWQLRVRRVQHTSTSGLPNLLALSAQPFEVGRDVIVAVIGRYEEILATLPHDLHGECARQIARRLSVGSGIETIFNGEGGHFAWTEEARPLEMQLNHLEGLRALFSAPLQIGTYTFDTNIHFGLDRNEGLDAQTRVNSALASANDALSSGRSVELFEAERLAEASWELSLHARIDEGLRNGEIWLAYQSQWDMRLGGPCGAEALIRWNHPTRGPIAPDAFILQAERAGRIDALTYWVVDEAITAALALNAAGRPFQMSINLSAQMVDKPSLVSNFVEIVRRRNIDARLLTIEVTETSSVRNRPAAVQNLSQLRAMGFRLSIDDFGTGEASLAYLADLPSDELKLDRRFVSRLLTHDRERSIISATIGLAHALGQTVVAEGIEDEATYRALVDLGCDVGQGYFLGRPQAFPEFYQGLLKMGQRRIGVV